MTLPIYANAALTRLAAAVTPTDLTITIEDAANFPAIGVDEFLVVTLVSNGLNGPVEIVYATALVGNNLTVTRAQEGTTALSFDISDQAYHSVTASMADQWRDASRWYLGAQDADPTVGNFGEALVAGMLYYNTVVPIMREYDGTSWSQFAVVLSVTGLTEYLWDSHATIAAGGPVIWTGGTDEQGQPQPTITSNNLVTVFVNGEKLQNGISAGISGGFLVDEGNNTVTLTAGATAPFTLSISVGVADDNNYIDRIEQDASSYGFVVAPSDTGYDPAVKLPTVEMVNSMGLGATDYNTTTARLEWSSSTIVSVAPGRVKSRTSDNQIILEVGILKDITMAWAAGQGNGCGGTAVPLEGDLQPVFLIQDPINGLVDLIVTNLWDCSDRPAAYTDFELVSILRVTNTTGSRLDARLIEQVQSGNFISTYSSYPRTQDQAPGGRITATFTGTTTPIASDGNLPNKIRLQLMVNTLPDIFDGSGVAGQGGFIATSIYEEPIDSNSEAGFKHTIYQLDPSDFNDWTTNTGAGDVIAINGKIAVYTRGSTVGVTSSSVSVHISGWYLTNDLLDGML